MKKALLAVAVAAALPAAAFAQSNVTLYGAMDVGYGSKTWKNAAGGTHSKSSGIQDGAGTSNRLGFMGSEDLGGGLKASFVWEQGYSPTSQQLTNIRAVSSGHLVDALATGEGGRSTTSLNRQTLVSLAGAFGDIRAGYGRTIAYDVTTFGGYVQCSEGNEGCAIHTTPFMVGGARANGIRYTSPRLGGLTVMLEYGAGTDLNEYVTTTATNTKLKQQRMGIGGRYDAGPLSVAAAHTSFKVGSAPGGVASSPATVTRKANQLSAIYRMSFAHVALNWMSVDTGAGVDIDGWQLSGMVPLSPAFSLNAGFGQQKSKTSAATVSDIQAWQVGARYNLSKRTTAYLYHGTSEDDSVVAAAAVKQKTMTTIGLLHSF